MRLSNVSQLFLLVLTVWFALNFRGVDGLVSAEPLVSLAGVNLAVLLLIASASVIRLGATAPLLLVQLAIWAFLQIETHWRGYVLGASPERLSWYQRNWGENWTFLPAIPGHTVPDAYHTVLFALIVLTFLSALRDLLRGR
jgi:hypothetical protein